MPALSEIDHAFAGLNDIEVGSQDQEESLDTLDEAILEKLQGKLQMGTTFKLRNWLVSRQRYWGVPIPIINCESCAESFDVDDKDLPLELLDIDFKLAKEDKKLQADISKYETKCPKCKGVAYYDRDTLDTFVDSSWYFLRFLDHANEKEPFDPVKARHWMPVDIYVGGMEHAIMHLLYARFFHKFLCDSIEATSSNSEDVKMMPREPFSELIVQGLVKGKTYQCKETGKFCSQQEVDEWIQKAAPGGHEEDKFAITYEKMSKSKGNGVAPGDMAVKYGVDSLRMAIMFGAPPENDLNFDENALANMRSYLDRVARLGTKIEESLAESGDQLDFDLASLAQKTRQDASILAKILSLLVDYNLKIEKQRHFHVAIARLMEITNVLNKTDAKVGREELVLGYLYLLKGLYPFAPHLASELWESLQRKMVKHEASLRLFGFDTSQTDIRLAFLESEAAVDLDKLLETIIAASKDSNVTQVKVSLNGKYLGTISLSTEALSNQESLFAALKNTEDLAGIRNTKAFEQRVRARITGESNDTSTAFKKVLIIKEKGIVNLIE